MMDGAACIIEDSLEAKNENVGFWWRPSHSCVLNYQKSPDMWCFFVFSAWKTLGTPITTNLYLINNHIQSASSLFV